MRWSFFHKKLFAGFLIAVIAFQVFFGGATVYLSNRVTVPEAQAGVPVFDWFQAALQSIWQYLQANVWPVLRDVAAKTITDYITQETLEWINNGEKPTYVSDWKTFVGKAADIAFDSINQDLSTRGINLCAPYQFQLQAQLQGMRYYGGLDALSCTVDDFKRNIYNTKSFIESGGWIAYDTLLTPQGNEFLAAALVYDTYNTKVAQEAQARTNEAISSSGFLGQKECVSYSDGVSQGDIDSACGGDEQCIAEYQQEVGCAEYRIVTPGDVAGEAVANLVGSDTTWGANIQSFTSAIVNALISKIFQKGLGSLQGSDVDTDSSIDIGASDSAIAQWNGVKTQMLALYEDMVFYYDSATYPTLTIWGQAQQIAFNGTQSCSDVALWTQKYDEVSLITSGIQTMVNTARQNIQKINLVDPAILSTEQLLQQIQTIQAEYSAFTSSYEPLVSDMQLAKANADMTTTQKTGLAEVSTLSSAVASAPSCGSPYQQ